MTGVTTPTCRLRPVHPDDVGVFFAHQADPEVTERAAVPRRGRIDHDRHWASLLADPDVVLRTVLVPARRDETAEEIAGYLISFLRDGRREVGYWLGRAFWGRGLATAALARFLRLLEERPLIAHVAPANQASGVVLLRNGFRETGTHRGADGVVTREFTLP